MYIHKIFLETSTWHVGISSIVKIISIVIVSTQQIVDGLVNVQILQCTPTQSLPNTDIQ